MMILSMRFTPLPKNRAACSAVCAILYSANDPIHYQQSTISNPLLPNYQL